METEEVTQEGVMEVGDQFTYYDYLNFYDLGAGIIRIHDPINQHTTTTILRLLDIMTEDPRLQTIRLSIASPGGGAYHAFAIYDAIQRVIRRGKQVEGLVEGYAASAASMIVLQACSVRRSAANARFLLHEGRRWIMFAVERTSDMRDEFHEMEAIEEKILKILSERTGKSEAVVRETISRKEVWMSAEDALEWGLIDAIEA